MALARDIMRATIQRRREQERRNAEAMAEEAERLKAIPGYRPPERKMIRVGAPENKMAESPAEEDKGPEIAVHFTGPGFDPVAPEVQRVVREAMQEAENPLADVPWASPQAYARAMNHGLVAVDFEDQEFSGRSGFTAGDVNRIAREVAGHE